MLEEIPSFTRGSSRKSWNSAYLVVAYCHPDHGGSRQPLYSRISLRSWWTRWGGFLRSLEKSDRAGSVSSISKENPLIHGLYRYMAFGLNIASDFLLPDFLPAIDVSAEAEVSISLGKVPSGISDAMEITDTYQVARNEFLLRVHGVAKYYVTNGNCVVIEPDEQSEERLVQLVLLGIPFGSLLLQRGVIAIHGSAVILDGHCVIFTGVCGAGKSTLSAAFRERGYPILTDDVAALIVGDDGIPRVHPGCPHQKLMRDSAEAIGVDISCISPVFSGGHEDSFAVPAYEGFWQSPAVLDAIYEITADGARDVRITRLSSIDKLTVLMNNTYQGGLVNGLGLTVEHFRHCLYIASRIAVSRLDRPEQVFSIEDQMRLVKEDLSNLFPGSVFRY